MVSSPRHLAGAAKGAPMEAPANSVSSEIGSPPSSTPVPSKGNWVRAVQGEQKGLKKYEVNVVMKDGVGSIMVPDEVKDASPLWDEFLMGKFLDKAPHIAKVHAIVNKIWGLGDKTQMVEVYIINSNTMKFRVPNSSTRKHILRRGMWNLAGIPVVMSNWSPFIEKDQPEEKSIPLWVHLKHVPMNMVSWKGLSLITSPVGVPVRLHPETAQCVNSKLPRIFLNADLTKELPKSMSFNLNGKETLVEYVYPWLPSRCSNCMKWGHLEQACLAPKKVLEEKTNPEVEEQTNVEVEDGEIVGSSINEIDHLVKQADQQGKEVPVADQSKDQEAEQSMESGGENDRTRVLDVEAEENMGFTEVIVRSQSAEANTPKELEWSDVSPGKASRSPKKMTEPEQVLTTSRFSVLASTEEEEEVDADTVQEGTADSVQEGSENAANPMTVDTLRKTNQTREKDQTAIIVRQSLPRDSKDKHRFLSDPSAQKAKEGAPLASSKKSTRKNN